MAQRKQIRGGLHLVLLTVVVAAAVAFGAVSLIPWLLEVPDDVTNQSAWLVEQTLIYLAIGGILIAGVGAALRACAHGWGDERSGIDHLGKLVAVFALAFAFWGATMRNPETIPALLPIGIIAAAMAAVGGLIIAIRWLIRRRTAAPKA